MEIKLNEQERCSLGRQNSGQSSRQSMQSYRGDLVARTLRMIAHTKEGCCVCVYIYIRMFYNCVVTISNSHDGINCVDLATKPPPVDRSFEYS